MWSPRPTATQIGERGFSQNLLTAYRTTIPDTRGLRQPNLDSTDAAAGIPFGVTNHGWRVRRVSEVDMTVD